MCILGKSIQSGITSHMGFAFLAIPSLLPSSIQKNKLILSFSTRTRVIKTRHGAKSCARSSKKTRVWDKYETNQRLALVEEIGDKLERLRGPLGAKELRGEVREQRHRQDPRRRLPEPRQLLPLRIPPVSPLPLPPSAGPPVVPSLPARGVPIQRRGAIEETDTRKRNNSNSCYRRSTIEGEKDDRG